MTITAQLEKRGQTHMRWASVVTVLACASAAWLPDLSLERQMVFVGLAVGLLGFPHGALDPLVDAIRGAERGRHRLLRFLAWYSAAALAVVLLWAVSAPLGLALFLGTSALHFGLGDAPLARGQSAWRRWLRVVAHGAAPIILPAAMHAGDVSEVFGWLLSVPGASLEPWITDARPWVLAGWSGCVVAGYSGSETSATALRLGLLELLLLAVAFVVLPPLLSFAVYFCAWHSVRHLITVDAVLGRDLRARGLVVGLGVLAATGVMLSLGHLAASDQASIESLARTLFVALAALTPPHMLVTSALAQRVATSD